MGRSITLARGEQVFLIGGNGSGKSMLARLLSGLVAAKWQIGMEKELPAVGRFGALPASYRFSPVRPTAGAGGKAADRYWSRPAERLQMQQKLEWQDDRVVNTQLSKQRKRCTAAGDSEEHILLLDEWAWMGPAVQAA